LSSSLPPAELARRDSALFGEVKCLFSTALEVRKETEANGGHCGDRTLHRTRSRFDRTRPVSSQQLSGARVCDRTLVWPDQRVLSILLCTEEKSARPARPVPNGTGVSGQASRRAERSGVTIGRAACPVTYDRTRPVVLGAYWTPTGRGVQRVRSFSRARPIIR
jgi:hypothetical protein